MLRIDVLTIFPQMFQAYWGESILQRACKQRLLTLHVHNLRRWTRDKHKTVDDRPYGGGAGMVFKIEPIFRAVRELKGKKRENSRAVLFSASGKQFDQKMAAQYAKLSRIILICGRYEGVDERVAKHIADEEVSIGPYVLTGGELAAMVVVDAVVRFIPGVLGNPESLKEESFSFGWRSQREPRTRGTVLGSIEPSARRRDLVQGEYPHYTRPAVFYPDPKNKEKAWRVPKALLSGDHQKIAEWRKKHLKIIHS